MARYYISVPVDGDQVTVGIECTVHCNDRASQKDYDRFCYDGDFIVGRLSTLLGREEFVDAIVNGIRMGEEFIIQDTQMGLDIAVGYAYDRCEGVDVLTAITTRRRLRVGDGQKVIKVLRDKIIFGIWRNSSRSLEVIA